MFATQNLLSSSLSVCVQIDSKITAGGQKWKIELKNDLSSAPLFIFFIGLVLHSLWRVHLMYIISCFNRFFFSFKSIRVFQVPLDSKETEEIVAIPWDHYFSANYLLLSLHIMHYSFSSYTYLFSSFLKQGPRGMPGPPGLNGKTGKTVSILSIAGFFTANA